MKGVIELKEIRVFSNTTKISLMAEVNDFIRSKEYKVHDIQYSTSGGYFTVYSVMLVVEANIEDR